MAEIEPRPADLKLTKLTLLSLRALWCHATLGSKIYKRFHHHRLVFIQLNKHGLFTKSCKQEARHTSLQRHPHTNPVTPSLQLDGRFELFVGHILRLHRDTTGISPFGPSDVDRACKLDS